MFLKPNDTILFFGDSITDCGRNREEPRDLGKGYAFMTSAFLQQRFPDYQLNCLNRGISGHRVYDLEARMDSDVLALKPTLVSILIGINDTGRRYNRNTPSPIPEFEASYRKILERIQKELDARLLIMEPFLIPAMEEKKIWREDLDPRIQTVRSLAREFKTLFIPLDGIFASQCTTIIPAYWGQDCVHPSPAGHALIANSWIKAVTES